MIQCSKHISFAPCFFISEIAKSISTNVDAPVDNTIGLPLLEIFLRNGILVISDDATLKYGIKGSRKSTPFAAQIAAGKKIKNFSFKTKNSNLIAVKKPVFPFNKFPNQKIFLSPEMRSTGEVIGFDKHLGSAYVKAELGAGTKLPKNGIVIPSDRLKFNFPFNEFL